MLKCPDSTASFGMIMGAHPCVKGLVIVDVSVSEAVRVWNEENPNLPVEVGHAVLEVNGVSRFCTDMLKEFRYRKVRKKDQHTYYVI